MLITTISNYLNVSAIFCDFYDLNQLF